MKAVVCLFLCLLVSIIHVGNSNATLWDRGGGLIYDDVLDVTWLQDANYMDTIGYDPNGTHWDEALTWVGNLEYYDSVRDITWTDWRLPEIRPLNGTSYNYAYSAAGDTDSGFNINSSMSELAYMFYVNLGNIGRKDTTDSYNSGSRYTDYGLINTGPFDNIYDGLLDYWSANTWETAIGEIELAFTFGFRDGIQRNGRKYSDGSYTWAVRDGDVVQSELPPPPVPEPTTILLFGIGLLGLAGVNRRKK